MARTRTDADDGRAGPIQQRPKSCGKKKWTRARGGAAAAAAAGSELRKPDPMRHFSLYPRDELARGCTANTERRDSHAQTGHEYLCVFNVSSLELVVLLYEATLELQFDFLGCCRFRRGRNLHRNYLRGKWKWKGEHCGRSQKGREEGREGEREPGMRALHLLTTLVWSGLQDSSSSTG